MTAVPTLRRRHDGWTAARQQAFLAALAVTRNVSRAAAAAGISRKAAYALRRHPAGAAFAAAWDRALAAPPAAPAPTALAEAMRGRGDAIRRRGQWWQRQRPCAAALLIRMLNRADNWQARQCRAAPGDGTRHAKKPQFPSTLSPSGRGPVRTLDQ